MNLPGYEKSSDWDVPRPQRSRRDQPSSLGRHSTPVVSPQDVSTSTSSFSATGPSITQSQQPAHGNAEDPANFFDLGPGGFTDPRIQQQPVQPRSDSSAGGGFQRGHQPRLHTPSQIQGPYSPGYPAPTDPHRDPGFAGHSVGTRCNAHSNIPVYRIRSLGCGCRLAYSGDGNVIAVLEEGAEAMSSPGSSMMASTSRGQGDFHAAHAASHSQWTGGQSSSGSGYPGNSMEQYNYPSS